MQKTIVPAKGATAVAQFLDTLLAASTRRQRTAFLQEYLTWTAGHLQRATSKVTTRDLLDEENALLWLNAAHRGATRRRPGLAGPTTPASTNSMAARTSTVNAFSRWCGHPLDLIPPAAEFAARLTPREAHRTLRLLSGHHPAGMTEATWERSVALIALAVCTGHGIATLHPLRLADLDMDRPLPRTRVGGEWYPVDAVSRDVLTRWLTTQRALTAGHLKVLQGGDVEELWVTTSPGRPRGGRPAPPAGLPAVVRTLEAAHRKLTSLALGTPLLLEQFCPVHEDAPGPGPAPA
ncbi:hypothetical protein ABZ605_27860 [Streptomyces sp. NPDC012765]|uniref:hypothetical protein n=1 Tax=Streptomyces sp. NPDC012765 TaxID=3155249 RepID=UPI0033DF5D93